MKNIIKSHPVCANAVSFFRTLRSVRVLLAILCLCSYAGQSQAGLKIYYLRHVEGGHNVVDEWKKVPKDQWPAYVGDENVFTPKGETQVVAATEKLQQYHFDFIAVSSMWRTRHTILPYLKTTGAKGEIWPELHEVDGGSMVLSTNLPPPSGEILNAGPRVELSPEEAPYFTFREGATNDFKLPAARGNEHEAAVRFALQHAIDMIHKRFGGTDKSILLVGHGNSGRALLKLLTGNKLTGIPGMANAKIWMVEEQPNGQFKFEMYNDAPYEDNKPVSASSSISSSTVNGETIIRFQGKEVWRGKADGPVFTRSTALGGKAYGAAFAGDKVLWESEPGAANVTRKQ